MPGDPDRQVKKTTIRLKPSTTLTLLAADGTLVEMDGDEALLNFITANKRALAGYLNRRFDPMYRFDFHGLSSFLDRIRLNGKYPLYTAQKHVVAAVARGLEERDSLLLVGQMGVGKTAIGGAASIAITSGIVETAAQQHAGRPGGAGGRPTAPDRQVETRTALHPPQHHRRAVGPARRRENLSWTAPRGWDRVSPRSAWSNAT